MEPEVDEEVFVVAGDVAAVLLVVAGATAGAVCRLVFEDEPMVTVLVGAVPVVPVPAVAVVESEALSVGVRGAAPAAPRVISVGNAAAGSALVVP